MQDFTNNETHIVSDRKAIAWEFGMTCPYCLLETHIGRQAVVNAKLFLCGTHRSYFVIVVVLTQYPILRKYVNIIRLTSLIKTTHQI
jgi:hypothetical protein